MKQRINLRLSLIAVIAIIATSIGITFIYYSIFQNQIRADLKQSANLLVETEVFQNAYEGGSENASALKSISAGNLRITWIDADGTVLFDNDTDISTLSNHLDRPEIKEALTDGEGESTRRSDTMNMNTFYYAQRQANGTILRVSTQARTISSVLLSALPVIACIALVTLIICVFIGHFLTRQLMKPIQEMADNLDNFDGISAYKELEPFAEKIRIQHENILAVAKSRQDFTASVSHELKTPITAISGYAELIENRMVSWEDEVHIAQQIKHNADRLLSLVTDIIQLSELDHQELKRHFEQVDLYSVAQECVNEYEPIAAKRSITMNLTGVSAGIKADRSLIREMVDNLLQNAVRYNKENGSVDVNIAIKEGHPILTVKDTGIGIPREHQDRVFERFYRVDKSRSRETGGTGLGLAIVKHVAEIHSASVTLKSEPGEGTEITVRF